MSLLKDPSDYEILHLASTPIAMSKSWTPEFPIKQSMQAKIDVLLLNRTDSMCECSIVLYRNG